MRTQPSDAKPPVSSTSASHAALVFIVLPSADTKLASLLGKDFASTELIAMNKPQAILSSLPPPHVDIPPDESDAGADAASTNNRDASERALLFERYAGQIRARIERAWERPLVPVNPVVEKSHAAVAGTPDATSAGEMFRCAVRIVQDLSGVVQEVRILACNGGATWQQSLVTAIRASSPLPAPPDPTVFARELTMVFEAQADSAAGEHTARTRAR